MYLATVGKGDAGPAFCLLSLSTLFFMTLYLERSRFVPIISYACIKSMTIRTLRM